MPCLISILFHRSIWQRKHMYDAHPNRKRITNTQYTVNLNGYLYRYWKRKYIVLLKKWLKYCGDILLIHVICKYLRFGAGLNKEQAHTAFKGTLTFKDSFPVFCLILYLDTSPPRHRCIVSLKFYHSLNHSLTHLLTSTSSRSESTEPIFLLDIVSYPADESHTNCERHLHHVSWEYLLKI